MKRKKILHLVLGIILAFLLCSCGFFGDQEYVCEIENVKSAQIIRLDTYVEGEYRYDYTVLCQIDDTSEFVEKLNNLPHSVNWGEPSDLEVGYIVIRIDYQNGDYDLIHPSAQWLDRSDGSHYGYFFFEKDEYEELISNYLPQ